MLSVTLRLPYSGDVRVTQVSGPVSDELPSTAVMVAIGGEEVIFAGDRGELARLFANLADVIRTKDPDRSWSWGSYDDGSEPF